MQKYREDMGATSKKGEFRGLWKKIWRLVIPEKVKNLMWKANTNTLSTRHNMCKRKVINDDRCIICQQDEEIVVHTLWNCPATNDVFASVSPFF